MRAILPAYLYKGDNMNISRAWALTQIVVRAHILNWVWRPRAVRSNVRCEYTSSL